MMMIVNLFVSFVEMILLYWLLEEMYPPKRTRYRGRVLFLLATTLSSGLLNESETGFIGSILCIVICILYAAFMLQGRLARKVATMAAYCTALIVSDFSTMLVADAVLSHIISDSLSSGAFWNGSKRLLLMLVSKFIFFWIFLVYICCRRKFKSQTRVFKETEGGFLLVKEEMLAAFFAFVVIVMVIYFMYSGAILKPQVYQYLLMIVILIYAIYLLQVFLIRRVNYVNQRTNELRIRLQKEQMAKKHHEECRIFLTELQELETYLYEHLKDMERLVKTRDYDSLCEYFRAVDARMDDCRMYLSGNESFDIVINQKLSYAREQNIHIQLDIQKFSIRRIADVDIVRLFSNVLDNAIEAVMLAGADSFYFSLKRTGNYIIIEEENMAPLIKVGKNGRLKTTKENKEKHGMGLGIVEDIARKYNGHCDTMWKEDSFYLKIVLEDS